MMTIFALILWPILYCTASVRLPMYWYSQHEYCYFDYDEEFHGIMIIDDGDWVNT